jgi:hypothetical protein
MSTQFEFGQTVRYSSKVRRPGAYGDYQIVRPLPDNGGEQQYRIKSRLEPHERVANQSELEKVPAAFQ